MVRRRGRRISYAKDRAADPVELGRNTFLDELTDRELIERINTLS